MRNHSPTRRDLVSGALALLAAPALAAPPTPSPE